MGWFMLVFINTKLCVRHGIVQLRAWFIESCAPPHQQAVSYKVTFLAYKLRSHSIIRKNLNPTKGR